MLLLKSHIRITVNAIQIGKILISIGVWSYMLGSYIVEVHLLICSFVVIHHVQELRPKGMDIRQEELGDLVDKEMAATSAAIEEAVRRIDVSGVSLPPAQAIIVYDVFTCNVLQ